MDAYCLQGLAAATFQFLILDQLEALSRKDIGQTMATYVFENISHWYDFKNIFESRDVS